MKYQNSYASTRPQMYHRKSRTQKAIRILKALKVHYGSSSLKDKTLLDVGASTGIIDYHLASDFKKVVGIDIDKVAINHAKQEFVKSNLIFKVDDAMNLSFKNNFFDVVVCTHVYEHVPNQSMLFSEIYRVLKPKGVCYLAAQNKLWPLEAHYNLPFLSLLPKPIANKYLSLFTSNHEYYESPRYYWELLSLTRKYNTIDYTEKILSQPDKFGYSIPGLHPYLARYAKYFAPTFFFILEKR